MSRRTAMHSALGITSVSVRTAAACRKKSGAMDTTPVVMAPTRKIAEDKEINEKFANITNEFGTTVQKNPVCLGIILLGADGGYTVHMYV